jgi:hypothetical protein
MSISEKIGSGIDEHLAGGSDRLYGALWTARMSASSKGDWDQHFNAALGIMLDIFQRLDPDTWEKAPGMKQYALMGCALVLRTGSAQPGDIPTLAKVGQALRDLDYRATLLKRYAQTVSTTDMLYEFWTVREPVLPETQKDSLAVLLRRFDQLRLTTPIPDEESQIAGFSRP